MKQAFAILVLSGLSFYGVAQSVDVAPANLPGAKPAASKAAASNVAKPAAPVPSSKPLWVDLPAAQQQALKPLAESWNGISESQKRKWLEVSKNYSKLSPVEQTTMHSRMVVWVAMSPQDRAVARLNFAKTRELSKELTGEEKKAKWETYQALSPAEKAKLAANASPKPAGAATAVKPVEPQKLAVTPKTGQVSPTLPATTPVKTAVESSPVIAPGTPPGTSAAPAN